MLIDTNCDLAKQMKKDLENKPPEKLTEKQKHFLFEMDLKEQFECGLDGW